MNDQCPRCLSTMFPKITLEDRAVACSHCENWSVHQHQFGGALRTVSFAAPPRDTSIVDFSHAKTARLHRRPAP